MKKYIIGIIVFLAIIVLCFFLFDWGRNDSQLLQPSNAASEASDTPIISTPLDGDTVTSPIQIEGRVSGDWFFEGSFPIELLDSNGDIIATGSAQALGDSTTTNPIDFSATLLYPKATTTDRGLIELLKANPSGNSASMMERFIQVILK